nr:MAG TPA: hypothetical protein [Caudoviricetes sp.]
MQEEKPFNPAEVFHEWIGSMSSLEKETLENDITTIARRINDTLKPNTHQ